MKLLPISGISLMLTLLSAAGGESAKQPSAPPPEALPPPASANHFRVSAGWMWRQTGDISFSSGSLSRKTSLPSLFGASRQSNPQVGGIGAYADRRYLDGYVGVDGGTPSDGATSLWGYNSDSQVRDGSLYYHAAGSRQEVTRGIRDSPDKDWEEDGGGNAPVVQLDWWRDVAPAFTLGAQLQWSLLQLDGARRNSNFTAYEEQQSFTRSFTDRYDLRGIVVPQAPYEGAGLGNGALIDNLPNLRDLSESPQSSGRAKYFNDIRQSLEVDVNTLSAGPTAAWHSGRLSLQASAGFNLNIASWDAEQTEVLYVSRDGGSNKEFRKWRAKESQTDFLPGAYLQGEASVLLGTRLTVSAFGRHEWSKALEGKVGPSSFKVDLDGWSAGLMVGIKF